MSDTNQIMALLQDHPCTRDELPYRVCLNTMSLAAHERIRRIRVSGRHEHKTNCGRFRIVYYLEGDDDRGAKRFVEVNIDALKTLDMRSNTVIDSGLTRELAQKIRAVLKVQDAPTRITTRQNEYLLFLKDGPKTSRDFVLEFSVSTPSVNKMLCKLRDAGVVKSEKATNIHGNVHNYELTAPYPELNIHIGNNTTGTPIADEEILYAAKLRNAGLTGQRLNEAYQRKYPERTSKSIRNIVIAARRGGLCR